ncbi:AarF/UbiB family protein [Clostridium sp. D33t1_170424_F3]|uniref:ABC1 kinase family protein n=1 Tax=Clostridium sp. D33t1_170424_F3 TaxID=2787099 RepID=UPI002570CEF9|nr:AarF/UbiB family protein [Clostridium sp. D33t1_170424_F3]
MREIMSILAKQDLVRGVTPKKMRMVLEELGPTFVKLGQLLSMRRDMIPAAYCEELALLRTDVQPLPFSEIKRVVESEYKQPLQNIFLSFCEEPLGSASIAQVHEAVLKDGRRVVVKVQRPGIHETMSQDITLLHRAADLLKLTEIGTVVDLHMVLGEMWTAAQQEMDFLLEAKNAQEFRERNQWIAFVDCPNIEHRYTTGKVLVMEYIDGIPIDDLKALQLEEYDCNEIGLKLADHYVKQVVDDGFFHADPHPGNIRIRNGKIVWIDLGMMGRLSTRDQTLFRDGVKAMARGDVDELKRIVLTVGVCTAPVDHIKLYSDIDDFLSRYGKMDLGGMNLGQIVEELMNLAGEHHISLPKGMSMLSRGILTLEGVLATLSPEINLLQIMANRMSAGFLRDFDWKQEMAGNGRRLYESAHKAVDIPAQVSDLLRIGTKGQAKLNLEWIGSVQPLAKIDGMVHKIVKCILAAAFWIGSCLLCAADIQPKAFGIPWIALLGFIAALFFLSWLLWDMKRKKR